MDQFQQLAAQQVTPQAQAPQMPTVNGQEAQPVQNAQPVQPETQAIPQAIPYSRFQEVVQQKNQAMEQAQAAMQLAQQLQQQQVQFTQQSNQSKPIETVDDLLSLIDSKLDSKLGSVVTPIAERINEQAFTGNIESYFAAYPEKASLRQDMANYAATLPPQEQNMLKQAITQGNTRWLDMLHSYVASSRQAQSQQVVQQAQQQQINQASSPTSFRSYRPLNPTFTDKIQAMKNTPEFSSQRTDAAQDIFKDVYRNSSV